MTLEDQGAISIAKIDAARTQLETAALLYFNDRDLVSMHTLVGAADRILEDLLTNRGETSSFAETYIAGLGLPVEVEKQIRRAYRSPDNFFKHADKDPDGRIEVDTRFLEYRLYLATENYRRLTGDLPAILTAYRLWLMSSYPEWVEDTELQNIASKLRDELRDEPRLVFLAGFLKHYFILQPQE